jgi:hypothetical protein
MARDFIPVDRGQLLLMPPSLNEWLPEDHLVWTVLGAVEQMDRSRFNDAYRLGGAGRAPFDRQMLVALLMYSYARDPFVTAHRAGLLGGRPVQGDHGHAHARSLHDRGVPPPP